jgi:hypothetical protein
MADQPQGNPASTFRTLVGTAGVVFCHFAALMILIWVLVSFAGPVTDRYERFCIDRALKLPNATVFVVTLSYGIKNYWYFPVFGLVLDGIVYFLLARLRPSLNWCAAAWAFVPLLLTILTLALITAGVCFPLHQLLPPQDSRGSQNGVVYAADRMDGALPENRSIARS